MRRIDVDLDERQSDLDGKTLLELRSIVDAWITEHGEEATLVVPYEGDGLSVLREERQSDIDAREAEKRRWAEWREQSDREQYERLKAKFESK